VGPHNPHADAIDGIFREVDDAETAWLRMLRGIGLLLEGNAEAYLQQPPKKERATPKAKAKAKGPKRLRETAAPDTHPAAGGSPGPLVSLLQPGDIRANPTLEGRRPVDLRGAVIGLAPSGPPAPPGGDGEPQVDLAQPAGSSAGAPVGGTVLGRVTMDSLGAASSAAVPPPSFSDWMLRRSGAFLARAERQLEEAIPSEPLKSCLRQPGRGREARGRPRVSWGRNEIKMIASHRDLDLWYHKSDDGTLR